MSPVGQRRIGLRINKPDIRVSLKNAKDSPNRRRVPQEIFEKMFTPSNLLVTRIEGLFAVDVTDEVVSKEHLSKGSYKGSHIRP